VFLSTALSFQALSNCSSPWHIASVAGGSLQVILLIPFIAILFPSFFLPLPPRLILVFEPVRVAPPFVDPPSCEERSLRPVATFPGEIGIGSLSNVEREYPFFLVSSCRFVPELLPHPTGHLCIPQSHRLPERGSPLLFWHPYHREPSTTSFPPALEV